MKWLRYTRCDGSADPVIPGEINTFLSLLYEDKDHNDINNSLKNTNLALEVSNQQNLNYLKTLIKLLIFLSLSMS